MYKFFGKPKVVRW